MQPAPTPSALPIEKSVRYLKGIGPKREEAFKKFGIETLADLFYFFPRRHEDRSQFKPIRSIRIGDYAVIDAKVIDKAIRPLKSFRLFELFVEDDSAQIACVWFNQPYLMNTFQEGDRVILSGKVEFRGKLQLTNPEYEILREEDADIIHAGRIVPVYPLTEGLAQRSLRMSMKELVDHYSEYVTEFLPAEFLEHYKLMELQKALRQIHFPESQALLDQAKFRLIFDELFLFELALLRDVALLKKEERSVPLKNGQAILEEFTKGLPFTLTVGQSEVMNDIVKDVSRPIPMTRLLQGEVGSGKTVCAMFLALLAAKSGLQAAFLAPTEILAEQQFEVIQNELAKFKIKVALLTGSVAPDKKQGIYEAVKTGEVDIVVGTHAVLQEDLKFKQLGVVIIDEQHKFGVRQRNALLAYEPRPHLLVMTATPIPRTLGLTLFGDLDLSSIHTLPAGRKPVKTFWVSKQKEEDVWRFVAERIKQGKKAYIICPRIEDNENGSIESAEELYKRLAKKTFKEFNVRLIHGQLDKKEQEKVMRQFKNGSTQILVATSVVEVGIHNPDATVMVIEDAERFGLAQLHQMRGRVGRGSDESFCFLIGDPKNDESRKRLRILTKTNDGFQIAEEDLKLRGPGDFMGTRQSGLPLFRMAEFPRDFQIMVRAREAAAQIVREDLHFYSDHHGALKQKLEQYRASLVEPV